MSYTAQSDQIEVLTWLVDNADRVEAGKRALGWADQQAKSVVGKAGGCSADAVDAWLRREWSPPTQQRLALMRAATEFANRIAGIPVDASNGNGRAS